MVTLALALLVAQVINAALIYRAQHQQAEAQLAAEAAVRLIAATDRIEQGGALAPRPGEAFGRRFGPRPGSRWRRTRLSAVSPISADMRPLPGIVQRVEPILASYDVPHERLAAALGPAPIAWRGRLADRIGVNTPPRAGTVAIVALQRPDGQWLATRLPAPERGRGIVALLIFQTIILYLVLLVPAVWLTRRLSRSLGALRNGLADFQTDQNPRPLAPEGPADIAELTQAFNAMSARIAAMLDEKDVMLGAIGHDLKTPLAALRVRVESVADAARRERMIASIEDITRTLDDILSLARIGRPDGDPEPVNVGALAEMIADEFRALGEDVEVEAPARIVATLRVTWIRRALRNLIGNAVRYGGVARVTVTREDKGLTIRIDDDGPGIPDDRIEAMFAPFARLEASRSSATGGSGLGLTLARAIAQQHGGSLTLANRRQPGGAIAGLSATLTLPVEVSGIAGGS